MLRAALLGVVAALAVGLFAVQPARADVRLISQSIENGYPTQLTFKLTAEADADITEVTLRYTIVGSGSSARNSPQELTPAPTVSVDLPLVTNSSSSFIPVGSEILFFWEITSADGATLTTPEESYLYLPLGFAWQSVSSEIVDVWYYGENEDLANEYLVAIDETYQLMGPLLDTELSRPARLILFASEEDFDPAKPGGGQGGFDDVITICGQHIAGTQIVFTIPQSCGTPEVTDTARHEFTHILTEIAGKGPLGDIPLWLNEGTAVHGQTEPGNGFVQPYLDAIADDALLPFASMAGRNNNPALVGLYYGQSFFMVRYLIQVYGPDAFAEYYATIKAGTRYDEALEVVYGFTLQGFEDEFRAALGLQPLQSATPEPTAPPAEPVETPDEDEPDEPSAPTSESEEDDEGLNVALIAIIGAAVLFALLAVFFYLISLMFERNRIAAAGTDGETPSGSSTSTDSKKTPRPPAWRPPEMRNPPLAPLEPEETWSPEEPPGAETPDEPSNTDRQDG